MPNFQVNDPAERFDLAYLFANGKVEEDIKNLAATARAVKARCAMVHVYDAQTLVPLLKGSNVRPEVVVDFPDGLAGWSTKAAEAKQARADGAVAADLVVNLRQVAARSDREIIRECTAVRAQLPEIKVICQIPYLWQKDREAVPWLLDVLVDAGAYCVKDWTTRYNFLLPKGEALDVSVDTRIKYTEYIAKYITQYNLPLLIKIAGGVDDKNARQFVNAGADLLGLSYGKAEDVRKALL